MRLAKGRRGHVQNTRIWPVKPRGGRSRNHGRPVPCQPLVPQAEQCQTHYCKIQSQFVKPKRLLLVPSGPGSWFRLYRVQSHFTPGCKAVSSGAGAETSLTRWVFVAAINNSSKGNCLRWLKTAGVWTINEDISNNVFHVLCSTVGVQAETNSAADLEPV